MTSDVRTIDLTPSPRVLLMLGQIEFAAWQCLAELIDNSVDGFTSAPGGALTTANPTVTIELPSQGQVEKSQGVVTVTDNGPGMSLETLEKAMKAGYSGNSAVDKLGLFGMGFNVATARLGRLTEVRTTRVGDEQWAVLTIDLDRMRQENTFQAPVRLERKRDADINLHGTRVLISRLEPARARYLASGGGRATIRAKLSRVYGQLIRQRGVQIYLGGNAEALVGHRFCTWSKDRSVKVEDLGQVRAILDIDEDLGSRPFCDNCWQYLLELGPCPTCGADGRVVMRPRRLKGWIGVQRYFDPVGFGFDLIRNGRVIEEASKSLFSWRDPNSDEVIPEYPLEQTHWGGRFVGELEVDFVPLASHQKDAFDRGTSEWKEVVRVIRGDDGPILEGRRKALNYPDAEPTAPFVRLHRAYRRGHPPGLRWLVPGGADGKGFNEPAREWADRFRSGDPEYQSDAKWWAAVLEVEQAHERRRGAKVPPELQPSDILGGEGHEDDGETPGKVPRSPALLREPVPSLSAEFSVPGLDDGVSVRLDTFRLVDGALDGKRPLEIGFVAGRGRATFDPRHQVFSDSMLEPIDLLVPEVVYQLWQRNTLQGTGHLLGELAIQVREQFPAGGSWTRLSIVSRAKATLTELREHLSERWSTQAQAAALTLPTEWLAATLNAIQRAETSGETSVEAAVASSRFPVYVPTQGLAELLGRAPELVFDGELLVPRAQDVGAEVLAAFADELRELVGDLAAVVSSDPGANEGELGRARLQIASGAMDLFEARRAAA